MRTGSTAGSWFNSRRGLLGGAAALVLLLPATALAHLHLKRSNPASGSRTASAPTVIQLWFTDPPEVGMSAIKLSGPKGEAIHLGSLRLANGDRTAIIVPITDRLANGTYTVTWRTASADGHPMRGHFWFVVDATARTPTP